MEHTTIRRTGDRSMHIRKRKFEIRNSFRMTVSLDEEYSSARKSNSDSGRKVDSDICILEDINSDDIANAIETVFLIGKMGKLLIFGVLLGIINPYFLIVPIIGILLVLYAHSIGKVSINYCYDAQALKSHNQRIKAWQRLTAVKKKWQVLSERYTQDQKRNAGATSTLSRVECAIKTGTPKYISVNVEAIQIELANKETLVLLPDAAYYIRKNKVTPFSYSDMSISVLSERFIEEGVIPSDAKEIDCTWRYVNVDGLPDRRFKDNWTIPVCLYGRVVISLSNELQIDLQLSNWLSTQNFHELLRCV